MSMSRNDNYRPQDRTACFPSPDRTELPLGQDTPPVSGQAMPQAVYMALIVMRADFLFTDRVRSTREGYVLTRVCLSVHTWGGTVVRFSQWGVPKPGPGGGGYPSQLQLVGGYLSQVQAGGYPSQVQTGGYPSQVQVGGTLMGYPTSGTLPVRPSRGVPWWGVPHLRYPPPSDLARSEGGIPQQGGTPPSSTWYATVGMPLAFTQEDFLFNIVDGSRQGARDTPLGPKFLHFDAVFRKKLFK